MITIRTIFSADSSDLGQSLAPELYIRGYNLVLVGRNSSKLKEIEELTHSTYRPREPIYLSSNEFIDPLIPYDENESFVKKHNKKPRTKLLKQKILTKRISSLVEYPRVFLKRLKILRSTDRFSSTKHTLITHKKKDIHTLVLNTSDQQGLENLYSELQREGLNKKVKFQMNLFIYFYSLNIKYFILFL